MVILQHIEGMYNLGMDASTSYLYAVTNEHAYEQLQVWCEPAESNSNQRKGS